MLPFYSRCVGIALALTTAGCESPLTRTPGAGLCDDFGKDGIVQLMMMTQDIEPTDDGKLVALGYLPESLDPAQPLTVMRLSSDGSLDQDYADGRFLLDAASYDDGLDLEVDAAGSAIFSRYRDYVPEGFVGRLLPNGSLDDSFGLGGIVDIGGEITLAGDRLVVTSNFTITVLGPDGVPDPAFGSGGSVDISAMGENWDARVQQDGKIVLVGDVGDDSVLVRLDDTGALDPSFGTDGLAGVDVDLYSRNMALDAEDRILVNGDCTEGDPEDCTTDTLLRLTPDGHIDPSFGDGGMLERDISRGLGGEMEVLPDGRILFMGRRVARRLPDGAADFGFGERCKLLVFWNARGTSSAARGQDGRIHVAFPNSMDRKYEDPPFETTKLYCVKPDAHD